VNLKKIENLLEKIILIFHFNIKKINLNYSTYDCRYAAEWYKFSPRLKSLLIITLYRSNIPCELKAGNMISLSIVTYATVIKMQQNYFLYNSIFVY